MDLRSYRTETKTISCELIGRFPNDRSKLQSCLPIFDGRAPNSALAPARQDVRLLLRVTLLLIGVAAGIIAAALSPVGPIFGLPLTVLCVRAIRAFGPGLHLSLERPSGVDCAHLKIAQ